MGGQLTVQSKYGVGSTFTVALLAEYKENKTEKIRVSISIVS
jgi:hypothetical protein